jgi:hypothetical protein
MAIISIPVLIGFGSGIWLSQEAMTIRQQQAEVSKLKQVSVQAKMLVGMLTAEIETLKLQAWNIALHPTKEVEGKILHWAELEGDGVSLTRVKQVARNLHWNGDDGVEATYLNSALRSLNLQETRDRGVSLLRIKKDLNSGGEWLSLAFPSPNSPGAVVLALVDPATVFQSYRTWASHSDGGKSRSYLLGSDGRVLTHSQKNWIFSDMSGLPLYREMIRKMLNGAVGSGYGEFTSMDQLPAATAFYRLGLLPLAVVVEEVNSHRLEKLDELKVISLGGVALFVLAGIVLGSALILSSYLVKVVTLTIRPEESEGLGEEHMRPGISEGELPAGQFFKGDEMLLLDSIRSSDEI